MSLLYVYTARKSADADADVDAGIQLDAMGYEEDAVHVLTSGRRLSIASSSAGSTDSYLCLRILFSFRNNHA